MTRFPPYSAFPELSSDGLLLREFDEADVPAWFARASNPRSSDLSGDPIPESIDTVFAWLERQRERYRRGEGLRWAIVPRGARDSVGGIGLSRLDQGDRTAELGAVVAEAHWGRGLGTAAARLVLAFGFEVMGLREVRADCLVRNSASTRALAKLGFSKIGDIRDYSGGEPGELHALRRS
jgi:ribosomal-protein-alanine N-acetyltransferase